MVCTCEGCVRELHNKELDETLGLEVGQAVTLVVGVQKWGSSQEDKDDGSHIILCSTTQNLTFYLNHCPIFEVNILRGKIYDLLTPHFHCNMLVRLMVGLVDMNVAGSSFEWRNGVFCLNLHKLPHVGLRCNNLSKKYSGMRCLGLNVKIVLCPSVIVVYISKWKSFKEIKTKCLCFSFHTLNFEDAIEFDYNGAHLICWYMNEVMLGCFQCCLGGAWHGYELGSPMELQSNRITNQGKCCQGCFVELLDGNRLRNLLKSQLGRNCNQRDVYHSNLLNCLYLDECDFLFELITSWDEACEENEFIRYFLGPFRTEYMGIRQWVSTLMKYVLTWFKWLIMMSIDKGGSFDMLWNDGGAGKQSINRGRDCMVLVMHWGSLESDNSRIEGINIFLTIRMQAVNYHVFVFKDVSIRSPPLKGTVHGVADMTELDDDNTVKRGFVESIGKCSPIIDVEAKTRGNVNGTVCVLVYSHIEIMNFKFPVAVTGLACTIHSKVCENNQMDCFLKESDEGKVNQIFDAVSEAVKRMIAEMQYQQVNKPIWRTENSEGRTECKFLCPFHYGRINCKMKIFQSNSSKYHTMLLKLPNKPMMLMLSDAREIELLVMLKLELKVLSTIDFRAAWIRNINAEVGEMRANCIYETKSVIEWMIAWRNKSVLRVKLNNDDPELRTIPFKLGWLQHEHFENNKKRRHFEN